MRASPWMFVLGLVAGCKASEGDFPVNPGGGGGGGGGGVTHDAAIDGVDGGNDLVGRVCLLGDPRDLTACASTGAAGLLVALGAATATTTDDGGFTIARPVGTNLEWHVTGSTIESVVMPFGTVTDIPAITITRYEAMLASVPGMLIDGQGGLMARVVQAGAPLVGATVTASPNDGELFYEGASQTSWTSISTGAHGTVWAPFMVTGTASISATPSGGTATQLQGIPITNQGITFVTIDVP